ncbi:unnamed protein product [Lasius platythorax]|uniref:Uncharacterized protein n=1 Tax=Lasius platythorax TaxID=488582 RepID=A0AAV2N0E4_9HYME
MGKRSRRSGRRIQLRRLVRSLYTGDFSLQHRVSSFDELEFLFLEVDTLLTDPVSKPVSAPERGPSFIRKPRVLSIVILPPDFRLTVKTRSS